MGEAVPKLNIKNINDDYNNQNDTIRWLRCTL